MIIMGVIKEIEFETEIFEMISEMAKRKNTTENEFINEFITKGIFDDDEIPDFNDLIGKYSARKPFNAVDYKKRMRRGESLE